MKKIFFIFVFVLLTHYLFAGSAVINGHIIHEHKKRDYKVFVPDAEKRERKPLVVVLHGGGGRINQIERYTKFTKLAQKEGFIAAYPQGFDRQWNDGREVIQSRAHRLKIDDVGFISKMIDEIKAKYYADPNRIYACGISNGGFMSLRLACELSDKIAAIGVVTAGMNPYLVKTCKPKNKVSVVIINGTDDQIVPYDGGMISIGRKKRGKVTSTEYTVKHWCVYNQCKMKPLGMYVVDEKNDGTEIKVITYKGIGAEVKLYRVIGGGHTWPGGFQYLPAAWVGRTSKEIDATEVIWEFFKTHPRK